VSDFDRIDALVRNEEDTFLTTLSSGSRIFDLAATETRRGGGDTLAGDKAFQLHDTYGFPIDLTLEMASEQGLTVDEEGFRRLMAEQRQRSKEDAAARKVGHAGGGGYRSILDSHGTTEFLGYQQLDSEARVVGLLVGGESVPAAGAGSEVE